MSATNEKPRAVILLSGGLDSATTLAIAAADGFECHAISFDYGQRHRIELDAARAIAQSMDVKSHQWVTLDLRAFGGSALTAEIDVPKDRDESQMSQDIPVTYVPARNTIFLSYAMAMAEVLQCKDLFIGVNSVDYSGYPDCRPQFINAFEAMANLATKAGVEGNHLSIHTPLIDLPKKQIIEQGIGLGVDYSLTHSCYDPASNGAPCTRCDSCRLRIKAFESIGKTDPLLERFGLST